MRDGVELSFREVSGLRPFVTAEVNGHPVSLMVHSNAGFQAMVTYDVAARAGLVLAAIERPDYGIEAAVFDVPQDEPVDGMLGIGWLRERRVIVDLGRGLLRFDAPRPGGLELAWDEDWQAYVVETSVAGRPARFVVSTVAGVVVDPAAADRLGLVRGPVVDRDGGPTGTVVGVCPVESSWAVDLGGRSRTVGGAVSWDLYAYADRPRPVEGTGGVDGFLGCEFLVREGAVIDFGRGRLLLGRRTSC